MKYFQQSPLLKRLCIMFAISIFIALGTTFLFYMISFHSMHNEKSNYVENISANMMQSTEDITASVTLMAETISNASFTHSFLTETNIAQKTEHRQLINRLISKFIKSSPHISNILLLDNKEKIYSFSSFDYSLASSLDQQYHILSRDIYSTGFTDALYLSDTDTTYYVYTQTIYDDIYASNKKKIGTCVIICSCNSLSRICENAATSDQSLFAILDSDNHILASNHPTDTAYQMLSTNDGKEHLIIECKSPTLQDWSIYCSVPYKELYSDLMLIRYFAVLLIIIMFLSFLLLAYHIIKNVVFPLIKGISFLQNDPYYVLHNRLESKGDSDIDTLFTNINQMLNQINDLTHTVLQNQAQMYDIELSKNQAQLLALQTQINPHFLYNTLNSIQGLAYQGKCNEICTSIASLSYMMRYNLNGNKMTCVKDEFLCIEKYLQIIELRFPKRFQFHLDVDDSILSYEMPRFLLQPLVENAISHGLEPRAGKGTLTLTASLLEGSILHFECIDNGVGIPLDKLESLRQKLEDTSLIHNPKSENHSGIALTNIHMRIRLIYGTPYGLSIYSTPEGTTVCADFPAEIIK